jgi:hypothetical protein
MSSAFIKAKHNLILNRKYREYISIALGEMVLIVLGILLALQIDNWNQSRQERKIIDGYLTKINKELQTDIQNIEALLESRKQALVYTDSVLTYFRRGHISDAEIFEKGHYSLFIETQFYPNKSAYESLKNSGYMKDLKNMEFIEQLNQYYQLIENISFVEGKFNNITQPVEISLAEKGFYNEYWNNTDTIIFTIQSMNKYPEYEATFIRAKMFQEELVQNYEGLIDKGKETVELIDNGN